MVTQAEMVSVKSFNLEKLINVAALELRIQNVKPKQCKEIISYQSVTDTLVVSVANRIQKILIYAFLASTSYNKIKVAQLNSKINIIDVQNNNICTARVTTYSFN